MTRAKVDAAATAAAATAPEVGAEVDATEAEAVAENSESGSNSDRDLGPLHGSPLMRRIGYSLMQAWVAPGLKNAYVRKALATGKPMTSYIRRALAREANTWDGQVNKFDERDGGGIQGKMGMAVLKKRHAEWLAKKRSDVATPARARAGKTGKRSGVAAKTRRRVVKVATPVRSRVRSRSRGGK